MVDRVLRHGEYTAPDVEILGDPAAKPENPDGVGGVLRRFDKRARASDSPTALGSISAVYRDAVQLQEAAHSAQLRGLGFMAIVLILGALIFFAPDFYWAIQLELRGDGPSVGAVAMWAFEVFFLVFVVRRWLIAAWQIDMFAPEDEPTIFDRKHRKVYRLIAKQSGGGWASRLKPVPMTAIEYEWDCITAEQRAEMVTSGNTVSRVHRLVMVVRDHPKPGEAQGRLLEEFNVGNSMALGEHTTVMLWEHIRRFMEEGGPSLGENDQLANTKRPSSLWQSMGVVSPFGPRIKWWWAPPLRGVTIFLFVIFPFSFPFLTLWAICNRISHMTMRPIRWPAELVDRLGPPSAAGRV